MSLVDIFSRPARPFVGRALTADDALKMPPTPIRQEDFLERPLPQSHDAERSVLGIILLDDSQLDVVRNRLSSADYFSAGHQTIFATMVSMREEGKPVDPISLIDCLDRAGKLELAGSAAYVDGLADPRNGVTRFHLGHYVEIVKEKALLRQLVFAGHQLQQEALVGDSEAKTIINRTNTLLGNLAASRIAPADDYRAMFHSHEDFLNSSGLNFAVDGFLQTGAATFFAGLSGHDKTNIMLSVLKASLTGKKLWDLFEVTERAARVVYLVPESSIGPFKHRLELFDLLKFTRTDDERLLVRTLSKGPTPCLSDPRILFAAKGADVYLDTAVRFAADGSNENDPNDMARGLAADIFALLGSGARLVVGAQHAPKSFAKETSMTLENILRGSGDIGAMLATCWGVRSLDEKQNVVYVQNCKPRDFEPCGPFQLRGRPHIDQEGDFVVHKRPGESGWLNEELGPGKNQGGAPEAAKESRAANLELLRGWLKEAPEELSDKLAARFKAIGITVSAVTIRRYKQDIKEAEALKK